MALDYPDRAKGDYLFFEDFVERAAPARLAAAFPASFAARAVDSPADFRPPAAEPTAPFALPSAPAALRPCLVPAAFLPAVAELARCWLRFRVAAAFFAAAERSALVCGIAYLLCSGNESPTQSATDESP
jgi:hypothetical protein